jgi:cytochrome b involved in lipid metabolism
MPEEQSTATETSKVLKAFSLEECKKHTTEQSCWLIIHGKVYDVTEFLEEHPGGYDIVVSSAGMSLGTRLMHAPAPRGGCI